MPIKLGIIGTGGISHAHARGLQNLTERFEVTALADVNEANLARMQEKFPQAEAYSDYHVMARKADVDAVNICLPHNLHADAIVTACKQKLHWICEKPLCLGLKEATQIEKATRDAGVIGMCAHNQIFMPAMNAIRQMLDEKRLGEVYQIFSRDCFDGRGYSLANFPYGVPPKRGLSAQTWRSDLSTMGGGELIDTGYHPTYRLLYLAGSEPTEVVGFTSNFRLHHLAGEDTANVLVRFENGIVGQIQTSWAYSLPAGFYQMHVTGELGEIYGSGVEVYVRMNGFEPVRLELPGRDTFQEELDHFGECIEHKREPVPSVSQGVQVLKLMLKVYEMNDAHGGPRKKSAASKKG